MSEENVSLPVAQALASALSKIEAYVPTEYVDNSEPDLDAEHLNHAEQGIMRVTNLLNAAVDVIQGQENRLSDAENKIGTAALTGGMTDLSSGVNSLYSNFKIIETGISDISIPANGDASVLVVFQKRFETIPTVTFSVVNSINASGTWGYNTINISQLTETGFIANVHNLESVKREFRVNWLAIL